MDKSTIVILSLIFSHIAVFIAGIVIRKTIDPWFRKL